VGMIKNSLITKIRNNTTKKNCKNVNDKILVSTTLEFLKFFAEKYKRTNPKKSPRNNE